MNFNYDYFEIPSNTIALARKRFPTIHGVEYPTTRHYFDIVFVNGADFGNYGNGKIAEAWRDIQGRAYSGTAYTAFAAKLKSYNEQCVHHLGEYLALQLAAEADRELASIIHSHFGGPVPRHIWELDDPNLSALAEHYKHIYGIETHDWHIKCKTYGLINNYGFIKDPEIPGTGGYYRHNQTYYTDRELHDAGIYVPKSEGFLYQNYAEATLRRLEDVFAVYYGLQLEKLETGQELHEVYDYMDGTKHLKGTSHYWDMKDKEAVYRDFLYGKEDDDDLADDEDQDDPVDYDDDDVI